MTGRTHAILGASLGALGAAHVEPDILVRAAVIIVAIVAALLPDVDHPRAIISGYLPGVGHAARLLISHRGPTHSGLFVVLCVVLLLIAGAPIPIVIAAGAALTSHLVADMATPQGIPLLWPFTRGAFRLAPRGLLWASSWALEALAVVGSLGIIGLVIWGKI